ncbi:MAG: flagellar export protein FliJ [Spirochaetaceae bacterium]|nr:flagellar export protein FliJ [Spirochaetaceae bacterium]
MKKFAFKFEKILNLRSFAEEEAKLDLARAVSEVYRLENELADTIKKRDEVQNYINNDDPNSVFYVMSYVERMQYEQRALEGQIEKANSVVAQKQQVLTEAIKQRKILSSLKERNLQEYKKEYGKMEVAELDESNLMRDELCKVQ